ASASQSESGTGPEDGTEPGGGTESESGAAPETGTDPGSGAQWRMTEPVEWEVSELQFASLLSRLAGLQARSTLTSDALASNEGADPSAGAAGEGATGGGSAQIGASDDAAQEAAAEALETLDAYGLQ